MNNQQQSGWGQMPSYGGQPGYGQGAPTSGGPGSPGGSGVPGGAPGQGWYPYGPPAPQPAKPGIIPLKPLDLGEIYEGAIAAVRHNPKVMIGMAALVVLAATLVGVAIGLAFSPLMGNWFDWIVDNAGREIADDVYLREFFTRGNATGLSAILGAALALPLAMPFVSGMLTISVSRSVLGDKASPAQVWARLRPRVGTLIKWMLIQAGVAILAVVVFALVIAALTLLADAALALAVLLIFGLSIALVVVAFWVAIRLTLVPAALVLESEPLWTVVRRAWNLTRGSFWRTAGIYLLATIMVGALTSVLAMPVSLIAIAGTAASGVSGLTALWPITAVTTAVSSLIAATFLSGVIALIYIDQRIRKENLAPTLAAAAGIH